MTSFHTRGGKLVKILTPRQVQVLMALTKPEACLHFQWGLDSYAFIGDSMETVRLDTAEKLIDRVMVDVTRDFQGRPDIATINNRGRLYLAELAKIEGQESDSEGI